MERKACSTTILNRHLGKATCIGTDDIMASRNPEERAHRRTKIVCTMGPACWEVDTLVKMMDAGMDIARLNFSHGDHVSHAKCLENIRVAQKQRPNKTLGIMLDTKGPEIRTGTLKDHKNVELVAGQTLKLVTNYDFVGDNTCIACSYGKLPQSVKPGNIILMADGSMSVEVTEIGADYIVTKVLNNASIGEKKNMNLPGVKVDLPVCGEREVKDIVEFGIPKGCHFVAASFVQTADDVREIRNVLGAKGRHIKIMPKIENMEGILNFDAILAECDAVMIARGDMGMEIPLEKVFLAQKMMIAKCNIAGKPVVTATQMLESMIKAPRPTRAEVSDVANAVLDGTDAVMLSGESANGAFPINAVEVLARTVLEAESCLDYVELFGAIRQAVPHPVSVPEAVCCSAVQTAMDINAALIIALTESGSTARLIAKYRPSQLILALSAAESTVCSLAAVRGILSLQIPSFQGTDSVINAAMSKAKEHKLAKTGDMIVAVHGIMEEVAGHTNVMKVLRCQ